MDKETIYENLCQEVEKHNTLYYVKSAPIISDYDYDQLIRQIEKMEEENPSLKKPYSPTQRVSETPTKGFIHHSHETPMLSLANIYHERELDEFIQRCKKQAEREDLSFSCELKIDGLALSVTYREGLFFRAVTRGNGKEGDDVTAAVRTIKSLPLRIPTKVLPSLEVRGEVYLPFKSFEEMNKERERLGEPAFVNPRNAASGSLKSLDAKLVSERNLHIFFYGASKPKLFPVDTQSQLLSYLSELGLPVVQERALCKTKEEILTFVEKAQKMRVHLPFAIDGIVVKLNSLKLQDELGATAKSPRWAAAYKLDAKKAESVILKISLQVGRTGVLTPVAHLKPTYLDGSVISRASLYNEEEIKRKDIREGDAVLIEKGGDVIPKVLSVLFEKRNPNSAPFKMPSHCPSCGFHLKREDDGVHLKCENKRGCKEQIKRSLIYFVSKQGMDIDCFGDKLIEKLIDRGIVSRISDIFAITKEELLSLEGFQEKSASKVMEEIEKAKKAPLARVIMALSLPHVGAQTAELIAERAVTMERFLSLTKEELLMMEGIGEKVATEVSKAIRDPLFLAEIERLVLLGLTVIEEKPKDNTHPFFEKTFVLTGTLRQFSREEATLKIKEKGGRISSSISKKTDFLLYGEGGGSKLEKAKKLSTPLMNEEEFLLYLAL